MSQEGGNRYLTERKRYKRLSIATGALTLLGALATAGSLCGIGIAWMESTSSYQPSGTIGLDTIPTYLVCSGAAALFTTASGLAWNNFGNKADLAEAKHQAYLDSLPPTFGDSGARW